MITNKNYFEIYAKVEHEELPNPIREMHKVISDSVENFGWDFVESDFGEVKSLLFEKLEEFISKMDPEGLKPDHKIDKPKPEPVPTTKQPQTIEKKTRKSPKVAASPKPKSEAKAETPPTVDVELVRDLDIELRLMGRFVNLHNKPKTFAQVLSLFNALNRAVKKGQIRKTSRPTPYHKELGWIQEKLAKTLDKGFKGDNPDETVLLTFDEKKIEKFKAVYRSFKVYPSIRLGMRFVTMEGRAPDFKRAQKLLDAIKAAGCKGKVVPDDPNRAFLNKAAKALDDYLIGQSKTVQIQAAALSGLAGAVLGCACNAPSGVQPSDLGRTLPLPKFTPEYIIAPHRGQAVRYRSDAMPPSHENVYAFSGRWRELLGQPVKGFSALIYGRPKSGKSTLAADLGGYLAANFGTVLYASIEEGARGTITERIDRLDVGHPRMYVSNNLPADLSAYDFVITDSVSRGRLDLEELRALIGNNPNTSFIFIFHVTKAGLPRGTTEFQHEVDVLVQVEDGQAIANGRFGPGEMPVRFS